MGNNEFKQKTSLWSGRSYNKAGQSSMVKGSRVAQQRKKRQNAVRNAYRQNVMLSARKTTR